MAKPLQLLTAWSIQAVFELLGEATKLSGNLLSINGVNVAIAEGCSGLRLLVALSVAAAAFAFGAPLRGYVRLLAVLSAFLCAVFCNLLRLIPTVWFYAHQPIKIADSFHDISAWAVLPVSFVLLAGISKVLRWALVPSRHYVLAYTE
jgi:exosortase/archaeosortase family protein